MRSAYLSNFREAMSGRTCVCTALDAHPFMQCAELRLSRRGVLGMLPAAAGASIAATNVAQAQTTPTAGIPALSADLLGKVNEVIDRDTPRLVEMYKDIHEHPEVAFTEVRTAGIVAANLRELGFAVTEGIGQTGVVGVLQNGPGPTAWFRADMDANSVRETTGLPYAATGRQQLADGSEVDVMHACGHDAHVTWLLGFAKAMVALKDWWSGTLVAYGQPAEEVGLGARAMVEDNLWGRGFPQPDFAFGLHTAPGPVGYVASAPGVRMAGSDQLDVTLNGIGGHGSTPQMTVDPVVMAAQAILGYQTIVSRTLDPQASGVVSVGAVVAGRDNNVIPETAVLKLSLRWFTPEVRAQMLRRIDEISRGVAVAAGVTENTMPTRTMKGSSGPLINDAGLAERVNPSLRLLLGDKVIDAFPAVMGSEDFPEAFRPLNSVPYLFILVGVAPVELFMKARAEGRPFPYSNHNPDFFVDLAAIPIGAKVNAVTALSILARGQ